MAEVYGLNKRQHKIADALWNCDTQEDLDIVLTVYGNEATIVKELIILASLDEEVKTEKDCAQAIEMLKKVVDNY